MTDIVGVRDPLIQSEQVDFQSPVSEATMNRLGSLMNFHAFFQHNRRNWLINGSVNLAAGLTGVDGEFFLFKNIEIVGIAYSLDDSGSAGTTVIDVHEIDSAGIDQGSIFTLLPTINSGIGSNQQTIIEYFDGTENVLSNNSGNPAPTYSGGRQFNAGSTLRMDLDSGASASTNLTFTLIYRPID